MANSTAANLPFAGVLLVCLFRRRFFRWRSSVLKLKPRLWQNSLVLSAASCSQMPDYRK
jgi:hypothetical protein